MEGEQWKTFLEKHTYKWVEYSWQWEIYYYLKFWSIQFGSDTRWKGVIVSAISFYGNQQSGLIAHIFMFVRLSDIMYDQKENY